MLQSIGMAAEQRFQPHALQQAQQGHNRILCPPLRTRSRGRASGAPAQHPAGCGDPGSPHTARVRQVGERAESGARYTKIVQMSFAVSSSSVSCQDAWFLLAKTDSQRLVVCIVFHFLMDWRWIRYPGTHHFLMVKIHEFVCNGFG